MVPISVSEGTGGLLKSSPEDFVVKEITRNGIALEPGRAYAAADLNEKEIPDSKFAVFVLQKRNWNTVQALSTIAGKVGRGRKSTGFAGAKDRVAVTVQLAHVYGVTKEAVSNVRVRDISINGAWLGEKIEMGSNVGNAFDVVIRDCKAENAEPVLKELNNTMPNHFGSQRFGIRDNNQTVGLHLMRNELEEAAMEFLTSTTNELNKGAVEARERLKAEMDFGAAQDYFPPYLKPERTVLHHLAGEPTDFAGALRLLPRGTLIMFIHAVQAQVFNIELEERIRAHDFSSSLYCNEDMYGFPDASDVHDAGRFPLTQMVGYDTPDPEINAYCRQAMDRIGVKKDDFKVAPMPELGMKGSARPLLVEAKDVRCKADPENRTVSLSFSLPSGSYATAFLNEVTKTSVITE